MQVIRMQQKNNEEKKTPTQTSATIKKYADAWQAISKLLWCFLFLSAPHSENIQRKYSRFEFLGVFHVTFRKLRLSETQVRWFFL